MSKVSINLADFPVGRLAALAEFLGGSTAIVQHTPPAPVPVPATTTNDDDDETGDNPAAPGTLDADGLPHDTRIHSEPAKLTTKGVWRKRRGVTDADVQRVEAELRSRGGSPTPPQQSAPMPMPPMPGAPAPSAPPQPAPMSTPPATPGPGTPPPPMPMPPAAPVAVTPEPAPIPAPPPAAPQPTGPLDFSGFMQRIQVLLQQKAPDGSPLIDAAYLGTVAQRVGQGFGVQCNSITDLAADQRYIDYAVQIMQHDQRWQ